MVEVFASASFLEVFEDLAGDEQLSSGERSLIQNDVHNKHISMDSVRCLHKYHSDINIHQAMRGSKLTLPYVSKAAVSKKEEAAKKRLTERNTFLQRQHETREYNRMVYGTTRLPSDNEETISSAIQSVKYQAAISSNMLAAVSECVCVILLNRIIRIIC
jgi:hypothetical protein